MTYLAQRVLNDTAQITNSDESTRSVQKPNVPHPRQFRRCSRRPRSQSAMPDGCDRDEESEDENLQDQTTKNDILAHLEPVIVFSLNQHSSTATLDAKAQDVTTDKDLSGPGSAHNRIVSRIGAFDEAAKDHVDGSGEQDRSEEDESGLNNVRVLILRVAVSCCTASVPNGFELPYSSVKHTQAP